MRLAKLIAASGIASRRQAENIIIEGRVKINGIVVLDVVTFVKDFDDVVVDNINISRWLKKDFVLNETKLWIFHKPKGIITSRKDPQGRQTIFELLPKEMRNVLSIGRLDYNTEGLILLTNNGALSRFFELPKNAIERIYKCRVFGPQISENDLNIIRSGITISGVNYGKIDIKQNDEKWFTMTLREGKNREIRKIFENFGMKVSRLIRVQYGEFKLKNLELGSVLEVSKDIVAKYTSRL
jgi:23S rRNA pseudouridine2605 synthase